MIGSKIVAPGKVQIAEVDKPRLKEEGVLVKMQLGAICGSDLHVFESRRPSKEYPLPLGFSGHEVVGLVEETTESQFQPGDPVFIIPEWPPNGFAQYVLCSTHQLIKLPLDVDLDRLVISQQLGTVIFCCRKLPNVLDMEVAIMGQGPAGLLFTAMLRNMGARKIIGIDRVAHRLEVSKKMGATHGVDASKENPVAAVRKITGGRMADLAVEAVGKPETINRTVDLVRNQGYLVLFGIPPVEGGWEFDYAKFFRKHLTTISSSRTELEIDSRSFKLAIDMIAQGRLDLTPLISHHLPLSQIDRAYQLALNKQDEAVKILLDLQA